MNIFKLNILDTFWNICSISYPGLSRTAITVKKHQRRGPLVGSFECDELVLYGIRLLAYQHSEALDQ